MTNEYTEFLRAKAHRNGDGMGAIAERAESAKAALKKSIAAIDQVMKGLING